ncbi:hypothetical protein DFH08DRAFT_799130 [Mycena albidolilacea]|uniref:Uncharacterized protein n=1 Tax=Mycena albidolilacea TaxID=1033008 RepID=A0AAD7APZ4_9AGAR|nr:hypothetical protein DFH08DRAFT_799130 [Mycena albidolilacea]
MFPRAESWIRWWMLPSHAYMLFPSFRVMSPELWNAIPDTTNPEEAMHLKLYTALGKKLNLLDSLKVLVVFADYYRTQFDAKSKRGGREGPDHDTAKALLGGGKKGPKLCPPEYEKGYKWKANSCWLNCSLMSVFSAASHDYNKTMVPLFSQLPENHAFCDLKQVLHLRCTIDVSGYEKGGCKVLSNQCNGFQKVLHDLPRNLLKSLSDFQSPFGWLYHISDPLGKKQILPGIEHAMSYFQLRSAEPLSDCWQAFDGDQFCDGDAVQYEVVLNLPIMLIIEIGDIASANDWDIPKNLRPYPNNSVASAHGVVYTITSHIYTSLEPVILSPGTPPHMHDGHAILLDRPVRGLLTGPSAMLRGIPEGYFPSMLVYHLDGGKAAQNTTDSAPGIPSSCKLVCLDLEKLNNANRCSGFPPIETIKQAPLAPHFLEDEFESDSGLIQGKIYMLLEIDNWIPGTAWHPAELVVFNVLRDGKEYKFEWIEGIVWWEEIVTVERLHEEQIGMVQLPSCFSPVTEGADTASPQLSQLLLLAVPALAHILAFDTLNPVVQSFRDYFKEIPWKVEALLDWMKSCLFKASPGLDAMLTAPLDALSAHEIMCSDSEAMKRCTSYMTRNS